jgi:hypothetical protein
MDHPEKTNSKRDPSRLHLEATPVLRLLTACFASASLAIVSTTTQESSNRDLKGLLFFALWIAQTICARRLAKRLRRLVPLWTLLAIGTGLASIVLAFLRERTKPDLVEDFQGQGAARNAVAVATAERETAGIPAPATAGACGTKTASSPGETPLNKNSEEPTMAAANHSLTRTPAPASPYTLSLPAGAPLALAYIVGPFVPPGVLFAFAEPHSFLPLTWYVLLYALILIVAAIWVRRALRELAASNTPCVGPLSLPIAGQYLDGSITARTLLCAWKATDWVLPAGFALGGAAYPWILGEVYTSRRPGLLPISSLVTIALLFTAARITRRHWHWLVDAFLLLVVVQISFSIVGAEIHDELWVLYLPLSFFGGVIAVLPLVGLVAISKTWWPYFTRDQPMVAKIKYVWQVLLWLAIYPYFLAALTVTGLVERYYRKGSTVDYLRLSKEESISDWLTELEKKMAAKESGSELPD